MGFTPDQAAAGSATELASVLAHNFYWMADEAFCTSLFERVKPFLPATVKGLPVRSINRRFRCYRYVPGAVYRPHVDGAWPPSGITPNGEYVYNASDPEKPEYSRFTFLVYLNDEFEGGETTFFVPAPGEGLEARGVKPMMGSVVVFPHGDAEGSLVHEGTGVTKGAKYIIRTDVVYEVPKSGRAAKE
jgi:predicted 2-oxoglutarate/Fe(II)-dependent dioxygenase YbiX